MKRVKQVFTEALDPLNKIANSIIKKLNYIESTIIIKSTSVDEIQEYLLETCGYHSNAFTELPEEKQLEVAKRVWGKIHKILGETPVTEEKEDLEKTIYDFLNVNSGVLYPLEYSAKKLADLIRNKR